MDKPNQLETMTPGPFISSIKPVARLFLFLSLLASASAETESPNIIVIMTDDQGYGDASITGNSIIKTPHIDSLDQKGAWLTDFYVSPVCTPTRAALMTGRYPQRTRAYDTYIGRAMMDPGETTVAELLKQAGYATGIFGKWHLGDCYPTRPSDQGFDQSVIHLGGGLCQPSDPIENKNRYTNPILFENNQQKQFQGYCTDM
jgi:arylsulfatase A-like enzyme